MGITSFFNRKNNDDDEFNFETDDILIVFDHDNLTSDIKNITVVENNSVICAGFYKVPLEDCLITTGKMGRNFFYRAPSESIKEVQRLAQLERDMVLSQITAYRPPVEPNTMDWTKGMLFAALAICLIGLIIK